MASLPLTAPSTSRSEERMRRSDAARIGSVTTAAFPTSTRATPNRRTLEPVP